MIAISEQMLKFQLGYGYGTTNHVDRYHDTDISLNSVADLLSAADFDYKDRTDYNLAESKLMLNQYDLKRHKYSGLPSLAAFGTAAYTYSTNTFADVFKEQYIFYSLGRIEPEKYQSSMVCKDTTECCKQNMLLKKSENDLENLQLAIDLNLATSRTTLKNAILASETQKRNLDLANTVLDLANRKYKAGVGSNSDVSQAQGEDAESTGQLFPINVGCSECKI